MTSDRGSIQVRIAWHAAPQHKDAGGTDGASTSEPMTSREVHPRVTVGKRRSDRLRARQAPTPIGEVARRYLEVNVVRGGPPKGNPR